MDELKALEQDLQQYQVFVEQLKAYQEWRDANPETEPWRHPQDMVVPKYSQLRALRLRITKTMKALEGY